MNLASIDLNRLLVLHAVLTERSVTRAAAALHVTPSAISNALARLRATFDDPLLVRSGRGLVLTPRATALVPHLAQAVEAMARVVEKQTNFEPARSTRTFTLACSDAEQISEVPRIAVAFARKLPRASLRVMSVDQLESTGGLAGGEVDVAIAPGQVPMRDVHSSDLYEEEGVLVVRKGHPQVRRRMSKEQFNALRHIDILLALGRPGIGHRIVEEFARRMASVAISPFRCQVLRQQRQSRRRQIGWRGCLAVWRRCFFARCHSQRLPCRFPQWDFVFSWCGTSARTWTQGRVFSVH